MRRMGRDVWAIVLLAVVVRLAHVWAVSDGPLLHYHREFPESDMYMFDQWAQRIVGGDLLGAHTPHPLQGWQLALAPRERWEEWYGDPRVFYKAPFYAYLLAALRAAFGDPMLPLALLQIAAAAGSTILLVRVGESVAGSGAARAGALLFALYGPAVHFDAVMLRGPWIQLSGLLVTWCFVRARERRDMASLAAAGAVTGAALLINEGFAALPALGALAVVWWFRREAWPRRLGAYAIGATLAFSPVVARNVAVGAPPFRLAVTGSIVYTVFNAARSNPYQFDIRPQVIMPLMEESGGSLLGAVAACLRTFEGPLDLARLYGAKGLALLVPFENPDNLNYYYAELKSPVLRLLPAFGTVLPLLLVGVVLHRRDLQRLAPLLPVLLSLLVSIAATQALSRYRVPLVVVLFPLAGVALDRMAGWLRQRAMRPLLAAGAAGLALAAGAATIQSRVVFGGRPASEFLYRPVEFKVGEEFHAARGEDALASAEVMSLVARSSGRVRATALLQLARIEARRGRLDVARTALDGALRLGANDPVVLLPGGDLYLELLQDPSAAAAAYRRVAGAAAATPEQREEAARGLLAVAAEDR